jgi:hypothetical protein
MRRTLGVGIVLLLLLSPHCVFAQGTGKGRGSRLKGNYPNPFNPTTTIVFNVEEGDIKGGKPATVTIKILNVLQQLVAIPLAMDNPAGNGPVDQMLFTQPGEYKAYWDATDRTGRRVASGIYYYFMVVNGERDPTLRRLVVAK